MQVDRLVKLCFGTGLAAIAAKAMLVWAGGQYYAGLDPTQEEFSADVLGPAANLASVIALFGLAGAIVAFSKGVRGQMLYAAAVLNGVAFLVNPMTYVIS